jgi:hypothetical protein
MERCRALLSQPPALNRYPKGVRGALLQCPKRILALKPFGYGRYKPLACNRIPALNPDIDSSPGGFDRLLAFVAMLGFGRATFVCFTRSEQFVDWRDGLIAAFEYFGGVPCEVLLNTRTVIAEIPCGLIPT